MPREKHFRLAKYLHATRHMWQKWAQRVYLDPFCGPGRIQVVDEPGTRDGGALVAWREMSQAGVPFTHVFVGDKDDSRADACCARLKALGAPARAFHGAAIDTVEQMIQAAPKADALFMAYIDPYNLQYLDFSIFESLAKMRADVAVNFCAMDLQRNVELEFEPERARFDSVAPGWRAHPPVLQASKQNVKIEFFRFWFERVKALGFKEGHQIPLVPNNQGHEIYRLVFLSKGKQPTRVWDDIAKSSQRDLFS